MGLAQAWALRGFGDARRARGWVWGVGELEMSPPCTPCVVPQILLPVPEQLSHPTTSPRGAERTKASPPCVSPFTQAAQILPESPQGG